MWKRIIYSEFTNLSSTIIWKILQYDNFFVSLIYKLFTQYDYLLSMYWEYW